MKTYDERTKDILSKVAVAKRRRRTITTVVALCCCIILITGILLIPQKQPESKEKIAYTLSYDPLIKELSALIGPKKDYLDGSPEVMLPESAPNSPEVDVAPDPVGPSEDSYEEVTDNQVQGVTEADIIKRSDKHIYYLRGNLLTAYSIEGKESKELGSYEIGSELSDDYRVYDYDTEMYLSQDCRTVTILTGCYYKPEQQRYQYLLSLDVAAPESIKVNSSCFLKGEYNTSRLVDNDLYVISRLYLDYDVDFEDNSTFLPGYGTPENMTYLPMEDICIPEEPTLAMYTVVTKLKNTSLKVDDSIALLSYTGVVYMSSENIYLVRGFTDSQTTYNLLTNTAMSEITRLNYDSDHLRNKGSFQVEGRIENQYWLDEYKGYLRVVTTIDNRDSVIMDDPYSGTSSIGSRGSVTNASLYCIELRNHTIRGKVEQFAPDGESVRSVRFDGDSAYVCTSIALHDPVFFFDLSDMDNIRYKDTGTIDGYSMSLVDFSDDFLMGIGYGDSFGTLKIEMYREGATAVESHCAYEYEDCWFSGEYKSYYIDRKNQLIGMGLYSYTHSSDRYILLHFDGYQLVKLLEVELAGDPENMRAVYIDGYLYLFGNGFRVEAVD